MDLNILLWSGGMLFSLGIFALKVGAGLGYGGISRKGVVLTLGLYLALFEIIALLADRLLKLLEPLLRGGPWLHGVMALGMVLWGVVIITRKADHPTPASSLALLLPCPVCLSAMTFSTWAALTSLPLLPWAVGLVLGSAFSAMTLLVLWLTGKPAASRGPAPSLGLAMIAIGLYFIASLFLPAKVEQARGMYGSFTQELQTVTPGGTGVWMLLLGPALLLVGFFSYRGDKK
jgi:predicted transporter